MYAKRRPTGRPPDVYLSVWLHLKASGEQRTENDGQARRFEVLDPLSPTGTGLTSRGGDQAVAQISFKTSAVCGLAAQLLPEKAITNQFLLWSDCGFSVSIRSLWP